MFENKYVTELIKDAINDEEAVYSFYSALARSARDIEDKKMLERISLDEKKHIKMFSDIYMKLTGESFTPKEVSADIDKEFINNVVKAIDGELNTSEEYRPILFALENQQFKNYLAEIISDEQNHAARLNFMYSKYR